MGDSCKILWETKNELLKARGPGAVSFRNSVGENKNYFPKLDEDGNWTYELPLDAAQFCLSQEPGKFFLLEPGQLVINKGSLLTGYIPATVTAVQLKRQAPAATPAPKAEKKQTPAAAPVTPPKADPVPPTPDGEGF